ncbi:MAG: hypothetical protein RUMPE_00582 [Eubacteriales bacterium SKADARSKE-1]|nr:hypothetical protein [Eubacteriales bacterium SKADARSKE-1]
MTKIKKLSMEEIEIIFGSTVTTKSHTNNNLTKLDK